MVQVKCQKYDSETAIWWEDADFTIMKKKSELLDLILYNLLIEERNALKKD